MPGLFHLVNVHEGIPHGSAVKNLPANTEDSGDTGAIPGLRRSPAEGNDNRLQYSCLENPVDIGACRLPSIANSMGMNLSKLPEIVEDRGAWRAAVHRVTKSWTRLSN